MSNSPVLLIAGASARAAAFSALRAGLRPWCVDLFADADLRLRCPVQAIPAKRYPRGLIEYFREAPPGPWMYTGALENHPALIERLSRLRPLWGNPADALRRVRSPLVVAKMLCEAGLPCPEVRMGGQDLPANKRWLVKPFAGAGGAGIRFWEPNARTAKDRVYFQEYIEGIPCSAVFADLSPSPPASGGEGWGEGGSGAARDPEPPNPRPLSPFQGERGVGRVQLLGVTEQLIGEDWLHAWPFRWCGNIGPISISPALRERLELLGEVLAREFALSGLIGVDFILRDDCPWPVEINPRYTGAVEVLEYADVESFLGEPSPVRGRVPPLTRPLTGLGSPRNDSPIIGKAILFAKHDFCFPADGPWMDILRSPLPIEQMPAFADIPAVGTRIETGQPVLTMFTEGNTVDQCRQRLRMITQDIEHLLDS
ncbi:MAG TPA: ATP-grasp domain-containing protein [Gemmataceae bacterium]|jgi:predicted ATP-grasp superfamily ATP-dependent carboligase|nr:ATP-grasp domain-containing protein [Gemmataceae bacterium]